MKPYLEQQKLGELITAEHEVLIETCESGNNHRCAIVGQNFAAKRSVVKQNFLEPTGKPKVIHTHNSWNLALICEVYYGIIEKTLRRHLTVQKDLGLLNSGMLTRGEVLCITVAVDQSTVKIGGNDGKTYPSKLDGIAEWRYAAKRKEPLRNCCN